MTLKYKEGLKVYARQLRSDMTDCEQVLWRKIRRKQILDTQFYRQKPVGSYILDFYAKIPQVAIELDGSQHDESEHKDKDKERDKYIQSLGITVIRFNNIDVIENLDGVLEEIFNTIKKICSASC